VRLYFSKTQGAFCKTADADRFLGSLTSARSDLGRWSAIGRSWAVGRAGRRRESSELISRGGAVLNFTGVRRKQPSGLDSSGALAWEDERRMQDPLVT